MPWVIWVSIIIAALMKLRPMEIAPGWPGWTERWTTLETPFGQMFLSERSGALTSLRFCDELGSDSILQDLKERWPQAIFRESPEALAAYSEFILKALGGVVPSYSVGLWKNSPWEGPWH